MRKATKRGVTDSGGKRKKASERANPTEGPTGHEEAEKLSKSQNQQPSTLTTPALFFNFRKIVRTNSRKTTHDARCERDHAFQPCADTRQCPLPGGPGAPSFNGKDATVSCAIGNVLQKSIASPMIARSPTYRTIVFRPLRLTQRPW